MDGNSQDSEDSSGDDLPSINMTPKGSIRGGGVDPVRVHEWAPKIFFSTAVKNLKGGEIIWAKYGRYPFWPAMVCFNRNMYRGMELGCMGGVVRVW